MAMCPLLAKECIREECAWWHEEKVKDKDRKVGFCGITLLPHRLATIADLVSECAGYE